MTTFSQKPTEGVCIMVPTQYRLAVSVICDEIEVATVKELSQGLKIAQYIRNDEYTEKQIQIKPATSNHNEYASFESWLMHQQD